MRAFQTSGVAVDIDDLTLSGAFTIESWVRITPGTPVTNADGLVSGTTQIADAPAAANSADINFFAGNIRVFIGAPTNDLATASFNTTPGVWTHYAITRSALGETKIYVDGVLDPASTATSTVNWTQDFVISQIASANAGALDGQLDEFRIWDVERTAAEIADHYLSEVDPDNPPDNLIRLYNFEGSDQTIVDATGADPEVIAAPANTALVDSTSPLAPPPPLPTGERALDFSIASVAIPQLDLDGAFTIEAWVQRDSTRALGNEDGIVSGPGNDINFFAQFARLFDGGNKVVATQTTAPDVWTHVAITRDAAGVTRIYLDGQLNNTETGPYNDTFTITTLGASTAGELDGRLDEVRIWTKARSDAEILSSYNRTVEPTSEELARYYGFDGDSGELVDLTGNSANVALPAGVVLVSSDAPISDAPPANIAPEFTSTPAAIAPDASTATGYTALATDPDDGPSALSYGISGGADATAFDIDSATGVLTFKLAPVADTPSDANGDNVFEVTVSATDGDETATQDVAITVVDADGVIPVLIVNPSFESLDLNDGAALLEIPDWDISGARVGTWNPPSNFFTDEAPDGDNVAFIDEGGTISQTLSDTFEAGRSYQLSVKVGDINVAGENLGWEIRLLAGNTLLGAVGNDDFNPEEDSFIDAVLTLNGVDLAANAAAYGQPLRIEIFDAVLPGENDAQFDDVRLNYVLADRYPGTNQPPVAVADTASTDAGVAVTIDALGNDTDPEDDPLTLTGVTDGTGGVAAIDRGADLNDPADDRVIYTPNAGFTGTDTISYTVSDGTEETTGEITITVSPASSGDPFTSDDFNTDTLQSFWRFSAPNGGTATLNSDAADAFVELAAPVGADTDPIDSFDAVSLLQPIANEDFTLTARFLDLPDPDVRFQGHGFVAFADADNWIRLDIFSRGSAGGGDLFAFGGVTIDGETSAKFNVVRLAIPELANYLQIKREGLTWSLEGSADGVTFIPIDSFTLSQAEADALEITEAGVFAASVGSGSNAAADAPGYTTRVDYVFDAAAPIEPEDGGASNAPPDAVEDSATTTAAVAVTIDVLANDTDPEGADPGIQSFDQGDNGVVARDDNATPDDVTDDALIYTPNVDFTGTDSFTYTVTDGALTDTATVTVTVQADNVAPVFTSGASATTPDGGTATGYTAAASDSDGGPSPVTYGIDGGADEAAFSIDAATGVLSFVSAPDFDAPGDANGDNTYEVTVTASDGEDTVTQDVTVSVTDADAVIEVAILNPSFEDPALANGDAVQSIADWDIAGGGPIGTWNTTAAFFADEAPDGENVVFIDNGGTISQTLSETFEAGRSYQLAVKVGDEATEGENLGWAIRLYAGDTLLGEVDNADFNPDDGTFIDAVLTLNAVDLVSAAAEYGQPLRIEIFDAVVSGENNAQFDDVRLTYVTADTYPVVEPENQAPVFVSATSVNVVEGATATGYMAMATDADGPQAVTYSISGGADGALFSIEGASGALSFVSAPDFDAPTDQGGDGTYEVEISAFDGELTTAETVSVTVIEDGATPGPDRALQATEASVDIPDLTLTGDFTIAAWIYLTPGQAIDNEDGLFSGPTNDLNFFEQQFRVFDGDTATRDIVIANTSATTGEWAHYAVTRENGVARIYVNGELDATSAVNWTNPFTLEELAGANAGALNGELDGVQVWDVARSQSEIQTDLTGVTSPSTTGLLRSYSFNGSTNEIVDDTGNSAAVPVPANVTLVDSTAPFEVPGVTPPEGQRALATDGGANAAVDIPDLTLSGDFTISAWIYLTPGDPISNADGLVVGPNNDLNFFEEQFRVFDGATAERDIVIANSTATAGEWTHYSVVRENGQTRLYVDGALDATSSTTWTNDFTIDKLAGTVFGEANGVGLNGQLDEVQIWDVARTQGQIRQDATGQVDTSDPNLLRSYSFDGENEQLIDETGNSANTALPAGASFVSSTAPLDLGGAPGEGEFIDTQVVTGLFLPTDIAFLPDGRMLVVEKSGVVKIVEDPMTVGSDVETYLDLSALTLNDQERGLLGVEVDPDFETNGFVYFFWTKIEGSVARTTVSRFTHEENAGGATSRLDLSSEQVIWQENDVTDSCCHQGGGLAIAFEPIDDNDPSPYKLYITTSDEFKPATAQDLTHDDGKIHRVNLTDGSIPTDNPYYDPIVAANYTPEVDTTTAISTSPENLAIDPEGIITTIHSHGLRNAWRADYDQESNTLFVGEVGGNVGSSTEDIHIAFPGADYGWPLEGFLPDPDDPGNPIHSYPHANGPGRDDGVQSGGASLTGGFVYRGDMFPEEFVGDYFYGDWSRQWIRYLEIDYSGDRPTLISDNFFKNTNGQPLAFEEGPDGALYYITTFQTGNVFTFEGTVNRISFEGGNSAPTGAGILLDPGEEVGTSAPYTVTFESDVTDPDGDDFTYFWAFGDGPDVTGDGIGDTGTSNEANPSYTYTELGQYTVTLTATDEFGAATVFEPVVITVGNAPEPVITGPIDGGTYRAGQEITLTGLATDVEDGTIPDADLIWSSTYEIGLISRPGPVLGQPNQPGGVSFTTPDTGNLESTLEGITIFLEATDSDGLSTTTSISLTAETAPLFFDAPVENYDFIFDQRVEMGDFTFDAIIGFNHTITAQETYIADGFEWGFTGWADGTAERERSFVAPETGRSFVPLYEQIGEVGQALSLDGSAPVDIPDFSIDGDFTVEAWVKIAPGTAISNIDGLGGSGNFGSPGATDINFFNGQIRIYAQDNPSGVNDPIIANTTTQADVWTHYAFVREGNELRLYIDGVLDNSETTTWTGPISFENLGGTVQAGSLQGELDEWRAWDVARTEEEINVAKNSVINDPANTPGLVRYYSFDTDLSDGTGDSATPALPASGELVASDAPISGGVNPTGAIVSVLDASVFESETDQVELVFVVTRSGDTSGASTVDFATADGTATAGADYLALSGTVEFAADETSKEIRISVLPDTLIEPAETLTVTLSNATDASISRGTATGTIRPEGSAPAPVFLREDGEAGFDGDALPQIVTPSPLAALTQGGVEVFATFDDLSGREGLASGDARDFGQGGHFNLLKVDDGILFRLQTGSGTTGENFQIEVDNVLTVGEPTHIFASFGPDGMRLYVNGVEVGADPYTGGPNGSVEAFVIGANNWGSTSGTTDRLRETLDGSISRIAVYSGQPDEAEVLALAQAALNVAPTVVVDDTAVTDEDAAVTIDVLANETDANDPSLALVTVSDPANGSTQIVDGEVVYTPNADFAGEDSFTYTASTTEGGEATGTVTVTVTAVDDDPVANDDTAQSLAGAAVTIDVLDNDTDADGEALSLIAFDDTSANGTITRDENGTPGDQTDDRLIYTPNVDAPTGGTDTFTYTVSDGDGPTDTATVTVSLLAAPNIPPTAVGDEITVLEDDAITFQPGDNDVDTDGGAVVAFEIASDPANGTAAVVDGQVTYTPDPDYSGPDSFTVTVTDGQGGFDTAAVTVSVTAVNDPPEPQDDVATTGVDTPVVIAVLGNDADPDVGDTLTVSAIGDGADGPQNGAVQINGGTTVTYTPNAGFSGTDAFTYDVTDGQSTETATVTVTVNAFPTPVFVGDPANDEIASRNDVVELPFDALPDLTEVTISAAFTADDLSGQQGIFSHDARGDGEHASVYLFGGDLLARVQNSDGDEAILRFENVLANTLTRVALTLSQTGAVLYVNGAAVDSAPVETVFAEDRQAVQFGGRGWGSQDEAAGFDAPFEGTIAERQIFDVALTALQVAELHDAPPPNQPPIAVDDSFDVVEDTPFDGDVSGNDSDPETDTLTFQLATGPANGVVLVETSGAFTYTPTRDFSGADSFTYTVSDGGLTDTGTVSLSVAARPDAPVAVDDTALAASGAPTIIDVLANDTDADGDALEVVSVTQGVEGGSVAIGSDGTVTYTSAADFIGDDMFEYTVSDGDNGQDTAQVTVTVSDTAVPAPVLSLVNGVDFDGVFTGDVAEAEIIPNQDLLELTDGTLEYVFSLNALETNQGLGGRDARGNGEGHTVVRLQGDDALVRIQEASGSNDFLVEDVLTVDQTTVLTIGFGQDGFDVWVNGVQQVDDAFTGGIDGNAQDFVLGANPWASTSSSGPLREGLNGTIFEFNVYDQQFTQDEVDARFELFS